MESRVKFSSGTQHAAQAWPKLAGAGVGGGACLEANLVRGFEQVPLGPWCGHRKGRAFWTAWPTSEPLGQVWGARFR